MYRVVKKKPIKLQACHLELINNEEEAEILLYIYYKIPVTFFAFIFQIPINVCTSVMIVFFLENT
jgi:hypothetical protein